MKKATGSIRNRHK